MECDCCLRNIQDLLSIGRTPYGRRFGEPFKGPVIPFGGMIEYHPFSAKDLSRLHQFGKNVLPGKFLGHVLSTGRIWKGDLLVADIEELEETHLNSMPNAKDLLTPMKGEIFIFPIEDGTVKLWMRSGSEEKNKEIFEEIRWTLLSIPTTNGLNTR